MAPETLAEAFHARAAHAHRAHRAAERLLAGDVDDEAGDHAQRQLAAAGGGQLRRQRAGEAHDLTVQLEVGQRPGLDLPLRTLGLALPHQRGLVAIRGREVAIEAAP